MIRPHSLLDTLDRDHRDLLSRTVSHFKEIARLNRFAENRSFEHDTRRCLICHPELVPLEPFLVYLEVAAESAKVRRPRLDVSLVAEINSDLALLGVPDRVTVESLLAGDVPGTMRWKDWLRDAIATGLGLLSVHSETSREFDLEEAEVGSLGEWIQWKINHLMEFQKSGAE
jgi:hypothetical protein